MSEFSVKMMSWIPFILVMIAWFWIGVRQWKQKKRGILVVFLLFICWDMYDEYDRIKPPPASVDSLTTFVHSVGDTSRYRIHLIIIDGKEYFEVSGSWELLMRIKPTLLARSGPPGYMFNQKGDLIDWTSDIDEVPQSWREKWGYAKDRQKIEQKISFEEALELIEESLQEPLKEQEDR